MSSSFLLVISAPSGCGKSTVLKRVMAELPGLSFSVSHTTRAPRSGERDGKEYHFVTRREFDSLREQNGFLEWAEVHGNCYGTSRAAVETLLQAGLDVILDIDVQGARQVMASSQPVTVFLAPPGMEELERRLRGRGTENEEVIRIRLANAAAEMEGAAAYDYYIVNDRLDAAVGSLQAVIMAERLRRRRTVAGKAAVRLP